MCNQWAVGKVLCLLIFTSCLSASSPFLLASNSSRSSARATFFSSLKKKINTNNFSHFYQLTIAGMLHSVYIMTAGVGMYQTNVAVIKQYKSYGHNWTDGVTYTSSVRSLIFSLLACVEGNSLLWLTAGLPGGENGRRPLFLKGGN